MKTSLQLKGHKVSFLSDCHNKTLLWYLLQIVLVSLAPSLIPLKDSKKWQKQNVPFWEGVIPTGDAGTLNSVQMRAGKHVDTIISITFDYCLICLGISFNTAVCFGDFLPPSQRACCRAPPPAGIKCSLTDRHTTPGCYINECKPILHVCG